MRHSRVWRGSGGVGRGLTLPTPWADSDTGMGVVTIKNCWFFYLFLLFCPNCLYSFSLELIFFLSFSFRLNFFTVAPFVAGLLSYSPPLFFFISIFPLAQLLSTPMLLRSPVCFCRWNMRGNCFKLVETKGQDWFDRVCWWISGVVCRKSGLHEFAVGLEWLMMV